MEAIEAHPQDSFSLPSVRNTKNGGLKKRLRVDRNIYVCLSRNVFRARGALHTPIIDIFVLFRMVKNKTISIKFNTGTSI